MFAVVNTPLSYSSPQNYAVTGQAAPTVAALGSLPTQAVHGAIALPALNNQRGNQAALPSPLAQTAPQGAAQSKLFTLSALGSPGGSPDFSSAFFTQLLAQSTAEAQAGIASSFNAGKGPASLSDPALLTAFSFVKYLPSDASKPEQRPVRVAALPDQRIENVTTPQIPVQQVQQQRQAVAQAQIQQQPARTPQMQQAPLTAVVMRNSFSYAPATSKMRDSSTASEESLRADRSYQPKEGAAAYARTASRIPVKTVELAAQSNT